MSVPFTALALFVDVKWAQIVFACLAFSAVWAAAYRIWKPERKRVLELEEKLRPKVEFVALHQSVATPAGGGFERIFEMEIKNDSGELLTNCLAVVTNIRAVKTADRNGAIIEDDVSTAYQVHLPLALRTTRNVAIDGGGPFHLRGGQTKKIPICERDDGEHADLIIYYEPGKPEYMYVMPSMKACDLEIKIYGAPTPTAERLQIRVNDNGELTVSRDAK